jgi:hypothetical protein
MRCTALHLKFKGSGLDTWAARVARMAQPAARVTVAYNPKDALTWRTSYLIAWRRHVQCSVTACREPTLQGTHASGYDYGKRMYTAGGAGQSTCWNALKPTPGVLLCSTCCHRTFATSSSPPPPTPHPLLVLLPSTGPQYYPHYCCGG